MSQTQPHPHPQPAGPQALPSPCPQECADALDHAGFIAGQDPLDVAAAGWMVRRQDGLSPEEEAEFQRWLSADPAHGEALEQVQGVWGRMDELPDEEVEALRAGLPQPAAAPVSSRPSSRPSAGRRSWLIGLGALAPRAAAVAVALCAAGAGWHGWNTWQGQPRFEQAFATARGQQRQVKLPDGSTLWLDTATRVEVRLYRQRREVVLSEGQALFAVQSQAGQPFEVLAGGTRVTVVGTRFAVRHTRSGLGGAGHVGVVVEQGRVRVQASDAAAGAVELGPGQSVGTDAAGRPGPVASGAPRAAAWREGRVSFDGTALAQALAEFERYADTGLVIRDPAVGALKVNGSFDVRQAAAFARALPQVLPVRLKPRDGRMEIVSASGG